MPRAPREKSESGIYHIMLRGINQQTIFEEDEDYTKFLLTLEAYKAISGYKVFAYCLMSNHIHILLKAENEDLDLIMKRIAGSYVYWYNWKYYRKGHLFQDRFKSEPIDDEKYLLTVLRYIHQNPIKANIVNSINEYKYSSYNEYIKGNGNLVDTDFVSELLPGKYFIEFNNETNEDSCLDIDIQKFRLSDNDAKKIIEKITKCKTVTEFQNLSAEKRHKYIKTMKEKGISIRQINRLTGLSKYIIEKTK